MSDYPSNIAKYIIIKPSQSVLVSGLTITVNSASFSAVTSVNTLSFDIIVKDTTGASVGSKIADEWIVPANIPCVIDSQLMKTGQVTSYLTGDDGEFEEGRDVDFLTLPANNLFGNTFRFTDELGGQTFTLGIVIDWSTYNGVDEVLGYSKTYYSDGSANWTASVGAALIKSIGTFTTGWKMTNARELVNICHFGTPTSRHNYPPFNNIANNNLYASTTSAYATSQSYYMTSANGVMGVFAKTSGFGGRYMICRNFTVTGTVLT